MATTRLMQKAISVRSPYSPYDEYDYDRISNRLTSSGGTGSLDLFIKFDDVPADISLHKIISINLYLYVTTNGTLPSESGSSYLNAHALLSDITKSGQIFSYSSSSSSDSFRGVSAGYRKITITRAHNQFPYKYPEFNAANLGKISENGVRVTIRSLSYSSDAGYLDTTVYADAEHPAYIDIETSSEVADVVLDLSPASGFLDRSVDSYLMFSPKYSFDGHAGIFEAVQSVFEWRVKGASSSTSYTKTVSPTIQRIPAGTLPLAAAIEWRVAASNGSGLTVTSDWATVSTTEALSSAAAISPSNRILSNSEESVFEWSHQINTGTEPMGADLQYSTDGSSWISFAHVDGNVLSYTAAPNSLPGGSLLWRVRTYNSDNLPGEWSEPARFVMIGAPSAPVLNVTPSPRPLIAWQSAEQQAWQLEIPGVLELKPEFGYTYQYRPNLLLDDGSYTARVRVQNGLGIWSEWAETRFTVQNVPGQAVTLSASSNGLNAFLAWSPASVGTVLIYRDGKLIAKTNGATYEDPFGNGNTRYKVRVLDGENYSESNTVTVDIDVDTAAICTVEDKEWLPLKYSQRTNNLQDMSYSREGEYVHVSGARLPLAEISSFENESVTIECAFLDGEESRRLYEMRSKLVCLKLRRGVTVIGPLLNLSREINDFYENYQMTVRNTHFEEAVSFEDD